MSEQQMSDENQRKKLRNESFGDNNEEVDRLSGELIKRGGDLNNKDVRK